MWKIIRTRATCCVLVVVTSLCLPLAAGAGTINVILSGFDVSYSGGAAGGTGAIFDVIAHPGGNLNPAEADVVSTAVFEFDSTQVGMPFVSTPGNNSYGDLKIDGVGATIPLGFHTDRGNNGGGFGFDWFSDSGRYLRLGINSTSELLLTNNVFFFAGSAVVLDQNLPFLLHFTDPNVVFSFTATLPGIVGSPATGIMASGALTISGTGVIIPEPATIALLCIGGLAAVGLASRRARA